MHLLWTLLFGSIALLWLIQGIRTVRGMNRLPRLANVKPLLDAECPSISILLAARNEAEKLPAALSSMLAQDYPRYEVIAVDDRSDDATPQILEEIACAHPLLKVAHVRVLPPGWLGKPHALELAYQRSTGDWLVFTDADVHFSPDLLRRAVRLAEKEGWDHLTLLGRMDMVGWGEKVALTFFAFGFALGVEPWQASRPGSPRYAGVGAFQLVRRDAYEAIGSHRRLAMEVVEDMKLGKLIKQGGYRSGVGMAENSIRLRWQEGLGNIIRGSTKNFFAAASFRLGHITFQLTQLLCFSVAPFAGLLLAHGMARWFALIAALMAVTGHAVVARRTHVSLLYALTHPVGGLIFIYMLLRSTAVTLWQGGIVWRDTFYPLEDLKRGLV
ncbi:MAG TPA: glycosyltransferase [Candidatus Acidoferrales bacterium]|nr:glycosyltransferase [Candidatus Acidoferrales bacterium]